MCDSMLHGNGRKIVIFSFSIHRWGIVEQNPRMNAIISSLSSGPIGFGDGL